MAKTLDELHQTSSTLATDLTAARDAVRWSSRVFNFAQDKNKELRDKLDYYKNTGKELTSDEIKDLRKSAEEARNAFEQYDERYKKKTNPAPNTQRRGELIAGALEFANDVLSMLDEKEAAIENKQVESAKQMGVDTAKLNTALEEGTESVHLGSQVYKDTMKSMKRYEQLLDKHANEEGKIDKKSFTPQELDEMIGLLQTAERGSTDYLRGKEEKNLVKNPKTAKRVHTMGDVKDLASSHLKQLMAIKDQMEKEPAKELDELAKDAGDTVIAIDEATKGVHNGSSEYEEAQKQFKNVNTLLKDTQDVEDYQFNSYQRRLFNANLDAAETAIDKYLDKKLDKDKLGPKEQKRVDAMRKAKNSIIETRKKINEVDKADKAEASKYSAEDLESYMQEASEALETGSRALRGSALRSGSDEYKNGKKAFLDTVNDAKAIFKDDKYKKLSYEDRQKVIEKLKEGRAKTESYIVKKHKTTKDSELNANGQIRMNAMYKAHSGLSFMIDKLQAYQDAEKERETKYDKGEFDLKVNNRLKMISEKKQTGIDRTKNNASKEAIKALAQFGKKENLTESEIKAVKYATAALLLDERISALPEKERKKYPKSPKEYAKMIKKTAESKEFAKRFPDDKITPSVCRKLAADPKESKKAMRSYFGEVTKVNNFEKQRIKPKEIENPEMKNPMQK